MSVLKKIAGDDSVSSILCTLHQNIVLEMKVYVEIKSWIIPVCSDLFKSTWNKKLFRLLA